MYLSGPAWLVRVLLNIGLNPTDGRVDRLGVHEYRTGVQMNPLLV